ncbi:phosphoesterase family protein [Paenibacillus taihuensis]|uniref:Phosphoesterase family protein n=1 Tax=Paenibacillus taihuensis TaxID=1156355 RepID=A0A3D9SCJ9_9BACL|nr:alkaline phosphatase family protein [Paenibacillus taihuensis]REE91611.1 phosphoesterase family protein [Paenibacillus taihuensis]
MNHLKSFIVAISLSALLAGCSEAPASVSTVQSTPANSAETDVELAAVKTARFPNIPVKHIVVVIEENHAYKQIVNSSNAPFMNKLIKQGALFTNAYAITHPSQPNYMALFSGSSQGVKDDSCKKPFQSDNLGHQLLKSNLTFAGYSEDLPRVGFTGCTYKGYGRKHNPWVQFTNIPAKLNQPFTAFPQQFDKLPTVSFVIPNHQDDMHDGTVKQADDWLKGNLSAYADWAMKHQSLLILTWDEDDFSKKNQIPVIMVGSMIKPGKYNERINHYNVLRTIEDLYGLSRSGASRNSAPITSVWK